MPLTRLNADKSKGVGMERRTKGTGEDGAHAVGRSWQINMALPAAKQKKIAQRRPNPLGGGGERSETLSFAQQQRFVNFTLPWVAGGWGEGARARVAGATRMRTKKKENEEEEGKRWEQLLPITPFPPPYSDVCMICCVCTHLYDYPAGDREVRGRVKDGEKR